MMKKYIKGKFGLSKFMTDNSDAISSGANTISGGINALDSGNEFGNKSTGTTIASSAFSGAGLGMTVGGPIGAGVGAVAGGLYGLFQANAQRKEEGIIKDTQDRTQKSSLLNSYAQKVRTNPELVNGSINNQYYENGGEIDNNIQQGKLEQNLQMDSLLNANRKKLFVDRMINSNNYPVRNNLDKSHSTHKLAWGESDNGYVVYPTINYKDNQLFNDSKGDYAFKNNDFINFKDKGLAERFANGDWKQSSLIKNKNTFKSINKFGTGGEIPKDGTNVSNNRINPLEKQRINNNYLKSKVDANRTQLSEKKYDTNPLVKNIGERIESDRVIDSKQDKLNLASLALSPIPVIGDVFGVGNMIAQGVTDAYQGQYKDALLSTIPYGVTSNKLNKYLPDVSKLNPFAKKSFNKDSFLRQVDETTYNEGLKSGFIKGKQDIPTGESGSVNLNKSFGDDAYYRKGSPYYDNQSKYPYMYEVNKGEESFIPKVNGRTKKFNTENTSVRVSKSPIPIEEANVYKHNWLKGYEKTDKKAMGGEVDLHNSKSIGGTLHKLTNNDSYVQGKSHDEGGVKFPNEGVELEGGETMNDSFVFSKELGFADKHLGLIKNKQKLEKAGLQRPNDNKLINGLKLIDNKIQLLKQQQEETKAQLGIDNDLQEKAKGGYLFKKEDLLKGSGNEEPLEETKFRELNFEKKPDRKKEEISSLQGDSNYDSLFLSGLGAKSDSNKNIKEIKSHLLSSGISENATKGIIANIARESNFNSNAVGDNGNSYGLFQHNKSRKKELLNYLSSNGLKSNDVKGQVNFTLGELNKSGLLSQLNNSKSAEEASDLFVSKFERPANLSNEINIRRNLTKQYRDGGKLKAVKTAYNTAMNNPTLRKTSLGLSAYSSVNKDLAKNNNSKNNDSLLEDIVEVIDPTGISSYDDVYREGKNYFNDWSKKSTSDKWTGGLGLGVEVAGALPIIGKLGKLGKGVKSLYKMSKTASALDTVGDLMSINSMYQNRASYRTGGLIKYAMGGKLENPYRTKNRDSLKELETLQSNKKAGYINGEQSKRLNQLEIQHKDFLRGEKRRTNLENNQLDREIAQEIRDKSLSIENEKNRANKVESFLKNRKGVSKSLAEKPITSNLSSINSNSTTINELTKKNKELSKQEKPVNYLANRKAKSIEASQKPIISRLDEINNKSKTEVIMRKENIIQNKAETKDLNQRIQKRELYQKSANNAYQKRSVLREAENTRLAKEKVFSDNSKGYLAQNQSTDIPEVKKTINNTGNLEDLSFNQTKPTNKTTTNPSFGKGKLGSFASLAQKAVIAGGIGYGMYKSQSNNPIVKGIKDFVGLNNASANSDIAQSKPQVKNPYKNLGSLSQLTGSSNNKETPINSVIDIKSNVPSTTTTQSKPITKKSTSNTTNKTKDTGSESNFQRYKKSDLLQAEINNIGNNLYNRGRVITTSSIKTGFDNQDLGNKIKSLPALPDTSKPKSTLGSDIATNLSQYGSDAVGLLRKYPNEPTPVLNSEISLQRTNLNANRASNQRDYSSALNSVNSLGSSNNAGVVGSLLGKKLDSNNQISQTENNNNSEISNKEAMINAEIRNGNTALTNDYNGRKYNRNIDIQNANQSYLSNINEKSLMQTREKNQSNLDLAKIGLGYLGLDKGTSTKADSVLGTNMRETTTTALNNLLPKKKVIPSYRKGGMIAYK